MNGLPHPTKHRLSLADAIAASQVRHYHWITPYTCDVPRDRNVTARVAELVAAGLAVIPDPPDELPESLVRLTPEGMAWVTRARTAQDARCERCTTAAAVSWCCTSHDKNLCHRCYRVTHFVEVCAAKCEYCAREGLPKVLTGGAKIDIRGPVSTSPETGPQPLAEAPTLTEIVEFLDPDGALRAESTKDEERTEEPVCPDYPDCREERYVSDLLASVKAEEPVGKWVSGCPACERLRTEGGAAC